MSSSTPSLCGSFLQNKRSVIAFTWTVTTFATWIACVVAIGLSIQISTYYNHMEQVYVDQQNQDPGRALIERPKAAFFHRFLDGGDDEDGDEHDAEDNNDNRDSGDGNEETQLYTLLARTSSGSMAFVSAYMTVLALGLTLYGSTAIVGFTSLHGDYIAPCISFGGTSSQMRDGIFGGAIVMFANVLLVCAVIFGEFRVEDNSDYQEEEKEKYAVERIATVLAVTCMFLAILYTTFAILLFLNLATEPDMSLDPNNIVEMTAYRSMTGDVVDKPMSMVDRDSSHPTSPQGFITIDSSSSSMYSNRGETSGLGRPDMSGSNKGGASLPVQSFMTMSRDA